MDKLIRKNHWDKVFNEKKITEVSWYQSNPLTSLDLIHASELPKDAAIIDVGCGDSLLIDYLIDEGYTNLYALDISSTALQRAKTRLGNKSNLVKWIVSDVTEFKPEVEFDFWHDRASFHFLTEEADITQYRSIVNRSVKGYMSIGTFSNNGPLKCSGLFIKQYDQDELTARFKDVFTKIKCFQEKHETPSKAEQEFLFCLFKKKFNINL